VKTVTGTCGMLLPQFGYLTLGMAITKSLSPKGPEIHINGQTLDAFGLKKGMKVDAQKWSRSQQLKLRRK